MFPLFFEWIGGRELVRSAPVSREWSEELSRFLYRALFKGVHPDLQKQLDRRRVELFDLRAPPPHPHLLLFRIVARVCVYLEERGTELLGLYWMKKKLEKPLSLSTFYTSLSTDLCKVEVASWVALHRGARLPVPSLQSEASQQITRLRHSLERNIDAVRGCSQMQLLPSSLPFPHRLYFAALPSDLSFFSTLSHLALVECAPPLTPANLRALASLPALTSLDLSRNHLTSLPDDISHLSHLVRLDLSRNRLKTLPSTLSQYQSLETLLLEGNLFESLPLSLASLTTLKCLDLSCPRLFKSGNRLGWSTLYFFFAATAPHFSQGGLCRLHPNAALDESGILLQLRSMGWEACLAEIPLWHPELGGNCLIQLLPYVPPHPGAPVESEAAQRLPPPPDPLQERAVDEFKMRSPVEELAASDAGS